MLLPASSSVAGSSGGRSMPSISENWEVGDVTHFEGTGRQSMYQYTKVQRPRTSPDTAFADRNLRINMYVSPTRGSDARHDCEA